MIALILAAGFGKRLKPFTEKFPKPLVPVNGVPLILYTLAFLKRNGVKDIVINLHHLGKEIPKLLGNGCALGLKIRYSHEPKILGTGGGIKKVLRMVKDDDVLVINGDVIVDFDLKGLVKRHKKSKNLMTFALYDHPQKKKYGLLSYEGEKLTSFLGEPKPGPKAKQAMFASYNIISKSRTRERFRALPDDAAFCIIRDVAMPELCLTRAFGAYEVKGYWTVCDNLADVAQAEANLSRPRFHLSYESELAVLMQRLHSKRILEWIHRVHRSSKVVGN